MKVQKMDRQAHALCLSVSWLEYVWNDTEDNVSVAVLDVDIEDFNITLYSDCQDSVLQFKNRIQEMMQSIELEVQNGYGGMV